MWLDGIYMLDVFYARWTASFELSNSTAWDDIALQVRILRTKLYPVRHGPNGIIVKFDLIDAGTTIDRNRTNGLPVQYAFLSPISSSPQLTPHLLKVVLTSPRKPFGPTLSQELVHMSGVAL